MMGVSVFKQVAEEDLPTGDVTVRMQFEADEAKAGDRRRGDAVHRRPTGREGTDGPHGADPVLGLRGDGHRAGQRWGRRPELRRSQKPFAFTGTVKKVVFDLKPHLSDQDELQLHAEAHRGQSAHGLAG